MRYAVSGSGNWDNGLLQVLELTSGRCVCTLEGHTRSVILIALTPDGRYVVSGSHDNTLRVWRIYFDIPPYRADLSLSLLKGFKERKTEKDALNEAMSKINTLYEKKEFNNAFSALYEIWEDNGFGEHEVIIAALLKSY